MGQHSLVITRSSDLEPDGVGGYAKAIWAGLSALVAALGVALADGQVTALEWCGVAAAALVAGGGTYWVPNKVKPVVTAAAQLASLSSYGQADPGLSAPAVEGPPEPEGPR